MNAGTVSRVLSLIPDRTARTQSGAAFLLEGSSCRHPERLALVSKFLNWTSPLDSLSKDDQRALGLLAANGRPVQASDDEEDADIEAYDAEPEAPEAPLEPEADLADSWDVETPREQPAALA
jgi:hypothetical protein